MLGKTVAAALACVAFARAAVLVNFQVAPPPNVPKDAQTCQVTVVDHTFGASYYAPSIYDYAPPTDCGTPGSWAAVTLNLTVTSNGTQYDRLAIMTFAGTEIWRTSTPEPTRGDGIIWTYTKDVTHYIPLFAKPGVFNMELNNVLTDSLNGQYATKVIATFYKSSAKNPPAAKSDLIVPIGLGVRSDGGAEASVPPAFTQNVTLPRNAVAIYAEVYASGNGNEEFWYTSTANDYVGNLPPGYTNQGPYREVRLSVDGQLAGYAIPYATFYTGAWTPPAWRPIAAHGALDLPTYYIDLTPFAPIFADGKSHSISIDVASAEADHATLNNWYVSANLQVLTDPSGKPTTGSITKYSAPAYATAQITGNVGANGDLNTTVAATRALRIEATIKSGSGKTTNVVYTQSSKFSNTQRYSNNLNTQVFEQTASGSVLSLHNGLPVITDAFSYPIDIVYQSLNDAGSSYSVKFDHRYDRAVLPAPFILGTTTTEHQIANGIFITAPTGNYGNGTNDNNLSYFDTKGGTYNRQVGASLNNITYDHESGTLAGSGFWGFPWTTATKKTSTSTFGQARLPNGRHFE